MACCRLQARRQFRSLFGMAREQGDCMSTRNQPRADAVSHHASSNDTYFHRLPLSFLKRFPHHAAWPQQEISGMVPSCPHENTRGGCLRERSEATGTQVREPRAAKSCQQRVLPIWTLSIYIHDILKYGHCQDEKEVL